MSATNWSDCKQCADKSRQAHGRLVLAWKASYGNVSADEYERARPEPSPEPIGETLREDYEMWIDDDLIFQMRYHASCDRCGFEFKARESRPTQREVNDQ